MLQVAAKQAGWDLGATLAIMPVPKIEETKVLH
jgi:hypothetical protein